MTIVIPSLLGGTLTNCARIEKPAMFGAHLFKCQHEEHGTVFCKIIPKMAEDDETPRAAHYIAGEIEAGRKLKGRHVRKLLFARDEASVPELGQGPSTFLVFEWVEHTLERVMTAGIPSPRQCLRLAFAMARALGEAHDLSPPIHHRDVKKHNVLVERDDDLLTAKLADFGISYMTGVQRVTTTFAGSPLYMAPEQFEAASTITRQTDIYALALLIWEALTGELPLTAPTEAKLRERRRAGELEELQVGGRRCNELHKVLAWALMPLAVARPTSTMQFAEGIGTAGIVDGLWSEDDVTDALEGTSQPRPIPRILLKQVRDERDSGGALELRLPPTAAAILSRITLDVAWNYDTRRELWSTRSPDVTITQVRQVMDALMLRDHETSGRTADFVNHREHFHDTKSLRRASNTLAPIVGSEPLPGFMIAQRVWQYIRDHELKAPNEDVIRLNGVLQVICGGRQEISSLELNAYVARHLTVVPT